MFLPAPLTVIVAQQGLLVLDLPVRVKEKPILVTFAASPQLTATATPTTTARGESVRLTVKADMPLSRIEIQLPGQAPIGDPIDYLDSWSGEVAIPADQPLGPTVITVRAWGGGDTPGVAEVKVLVVKPSMSPRLSVTAAPSTVTPGGIITLKVTADMYLSRVEAKLDGPTPCRESGQRSDLVRPAQGAGRLAVRTSRHHRPGLEWRSRTRYCPGPGLGGPALDYQDRGPA